MSLPDLYCNKFRIVHALGNSQDSYSFVKIPKLNNLLTNEEDYEENLSENEETMNVKSSLTLNNFIGRQFI